MRVMAQKITLELTMRHMKDIIIDSGQYNSQSILKLWEQKNFVHADSACRGYNIKAIRDRLYLDAIKMEKNARFETTVKSRWGWAAGHNPPRTNSGVAFNSIKHLLKSYVILKFTLNIIEKLFVNFLAAYSLQHSNPTPAINFEEWALGTWKTKTESIGDMIFAFPIPSKAQLDSASTEGAFNESLAWKKGESLWKGKHALTLFFFELFVYFGVLDINKSLDQQHIYAVGLGDADFFQKKMTTDHNIFQETKTNRGLILHGKHTHMLQLAIILIADRRKIFDLSMKPHELVPELVSAQSINASKTSAWNHCLEVPNVYFNNSIMLHSTFAPPTLNQYWTKSTLKWLQQTKFHQQCDRIYITRLIERLNIVHPHPVPQYWVDAHAATKISENLYYKANRDSDFEQTEAAIRRNADNRRPAIDKIIEPKIST